MKIIQKKIFPGSSKILPKTSNIFPSKFTAKYPNTMIKLRYYSTNDRVIEVNDSNFEEKISNNDVPFILDCYTDWCQPCKKLKPLLVERVMAYPKVVLLTANVEENPKIADKFQVKAVPSVYGLYQGEILDNFVGVPSDPELDLFVDFIACYPKNKKLDEEEKLKGNNEDVLLKEN